MFLGNKIRGLREMLAFDNYVQLVLSRLLFRGTSLAVYRKNGLEFLVDQHTGDVAGIRNLLTSRMYSQFFSRLSCLQDKPLNVFDLGAHVGGFPILLHVHGFTINRLSCVELNPATYRRLCFNIANNLKCEFEPVQGAVCGERKQFSLLLEDGSTSDSIYETESKEQAPRQSSRSIVEGWTLDDLARRTFPKNEIIELCKIDIEGAEYEVVLSPSSCETIQRCAYLFMEIHPNKSYSESQLIDRLAEYNIVPEAKDVNEHVFLFKNKRLCG